MQEPLSRHNKRRKNKNQKFYPITHKPEKRGTLPDLMKALAYWDEGLEESDAMRLIAIGSTGMALLGHKSLPKDIEFLIPDKKEYGQMTDFLKKAKYSQEGSGRGWERSNQPFVFHLSSGNKVYQAELLGSPLQNSGHRKIEEMKKIYLGVLNPIDIVISKLFRGKDTDFQDCLTLIKHEKINLLQLKSRFRETALYDLRETKLMQNLDRLLSRVA